MLRLRPYKSCDAKEIISWSNNEDIFYKWSGGMFGDYPISPELMDDQYRNNNGFCVEADNFYPMTAFDDDGIVGHFIMRYTDGNNRNLCFGWVIVDDRKRGKGYGKEMIKLALKYAFEILKVDKVTMGAFENNMPAYYCYKAAGFKDASLEEDFYAEIDGEKWKILELEYSKEDYL